MTQVGQLLTECQEVAQERLVAGDSDEPPPTLVVPLDQAEELFSVDAGIEARQLMTMLRELITGGLDLIVAATIRTSRYEAMQSAPELAGLQSVTFNDLKPMPVHRLKEVITGPAARVTGVRQRLNLDPIWSGSCWPTAHTARTPCRSCP